MYITQSALQYRLRGVIVPTHRSHVHSDISPYMVKTLVITRRSGAFHSLES